MRSATRCMIDARKQPGREAWVLDSPWDVRSCRTEKWEQVRDAIYDQRWRRAGREALSECLAACRKKLPRWEVGTGAQRDEETIGNG